MASSLQDIVLPEEIEYFVQSLREFQLREVGNEKWMDCHEMIVKLSQQAVIEISTYREETVKEMLIFHSKLQTLIHESFCIMIWKTKILPLLLETNSNPQATFLMYSVLFHEGSVITLLELVLYHQNGCESLGEAAIDLIDYCAQAITQLIGLVHLGHHEDIHIDVEDSTLTEFERQKRDISYKIGLRCLSIMNYLVDKADSLLLSAVKRMVTVHDVPCILSEILHIRPWLRKTKQGYEKFIDEKWTPVKGLQILKVTKTEAQTWFCLRQLLFNKTIMEFYEANDFRKTELAKCQGLLNETILDQLPPLIDLKQFLSNFQISGGQKITNSLHMRQNNLIFEEIPQIKQKFLDEVKNYSDDKNNLDNGYIIIAQEQAEIFLNTKRNEIFDIAKRLNKAYNFDLFAELEDKNNMEKQSACGNGQEKICNKCYKEADKKCSKCMSVFYCSRDCQIMDWTNHKKECMKVKYKI